MKQLIVDCSKPLEEQATVIDMPEPEVAKILQAFAADAAREAEPKPKSLEQRLAELEQELATLKGK